MGCQKQCPGKMWNCQYLSNYFPGWKTKAVLCEWNWTPLRKVEEKREQTGRDHSPVSLCAKQRKIIPSWRNAICASLRTWSQLSGKPEQWALIWAERREGKTVHHPGSLPTSTVKRWVFLRAQTNRTNCIPSSFVFSTSNMTLVLISPVLPSKFLSPHLPLIILKCYEYVYVHVLSSLAAEFW